VLPSVIVGGLLVGGLALGMGTAFAAETCTSNGKTYDLTGITDVVSTAAGACAPKAGVTSSLDALLVALTPITTGSTGSATDTTTIPTPAPTSAPVPLPVATTTTHPARRTRVQGATAPAAGAPALPAAAPPRGAVVAPPAALPGLPLAPALPGLAAPGLAGAFAPSALAGGSLPGGLSASLFGANFGNPALLAGTPLGAAAASLYQPQADSAVTTVSHSEALAAGAPHGLGAPTAIAAIALACVVGLVVRRGVLGRIARSELAAGALVEEPVEGGPGTVRPVPADDLVMADEPLLAA
jgi:hypothetical protein